MRVEAKRAAELVSRGEQREEAQLALEREAQCVAEDIEQSRIELSQVQSALAKREERVAALRQREARLKEMLSRVRPGSAVDG